MQENPVDPGEVLSHRDTWIIAVAEWSAGEHINVGSGCMKRY